MDSYHVWLKDKSVLRQIDQWVEITTPYLDRHNDYIQIYAKQANCGIRYTPKVKFTGKSGYDHLFDFVIPKSRQQPERIIQAINRPNAVHSARAFRNQAVVR